MDTNNAVSLAQEFWNTVDFKGKEFTKVKENTIVFCPGNHWPETQLLEWSLHTSAESFLPFLEKYEEWKKEYESMLDNWEQANNKENLALLEDVESLIVRGMEEKMIGQTWQILEDLEKKRISLYEVHQLQLIELENILQEQKSINQKVEWDNAILNDAKSLNDTWNEICSYKHTEIEPYKKEWNELRLEFNEKRNKYLDELSMQQMHNLDQKMQLCEKAEALKDSKNWKKTSDEMKALMDAWRVIGPLPSYEKNEELWLRFREARDYFFEQRNAHFAQVEKEEKENLNKKMLLIAEAEKLTGEPWRENTERHQQIIEEWKKIGNVPFDQIQSIWERLQKARDAFFQAKREQARAFKEELENNFHIKSKLVEQAEKLQNSTQWREATDAFNELMEQWKSVGRISREHGDALWNRFIQARRNFFDRKDKNREERRARYEEFIEKEYLDLKNHLQDEKEKLKEFKENALRLKGDDVKERELKTHLNNLIKKIEDNLPKLEEKFKDIEKRFKESKS